MGTGPECFCSTRVLLLPVIMYLFTFLQRARGGREGLLYVVKCARKKTGYVCRCCQRVPLWRGWSPSSGRGVWVQDDDGTGKNPLQHLMAAIGEGLKHLGQTMSHGCAAVGDFMIGLGYQIHNLL